MRNFLVRFVFSFALLLSQFTLLGHFEPTTLSISFSSQKGPHSVIIPFTYINSLIVLKASVNNVEGNFILDTGANGLVLNDKYFESNLISSNISYGISGSVNQVGKMGVDTIILDDLVIQNIDAEVINLEAVELNKKMKILGLIGYDVLQNFELLFNYRERFMTFSRIDKDGNIMDVLPHILNKKDSFDLELGNFIPMVNVYVEGKVKRMGIDSGAEYNVLDIKRNKDIMIHFKVTNRINIVGTDGKKVQGLAGQLYRLRLNDKYRCGGMATILLKLNNLDEIYQIRLDGILGHPFLAPWIFSINYRKKKLYLHQLTLNKS